MKTLTVYSLVCAIILLPRADAKTLMVKRSCPIGWIESNGRCFYYTAEKLPWARAEKKCQSIGANLASVHSNKEYHDIKMMIARITNEFGRTWLGGSDCQWEGTWLWSDGTPFKHRECGTFDNRLWRQHCLQMNYGSQRCWDDERCGTKLPSVCAKKLDPGA